MVRLLRLRWEMILLVLWKRTSWQWVTCQNIKKQQILEAVKPPTTRSHELRCHSCVRGYCQGQSQGYSHYRVVVLDHFQTRPEFRSTYTPAKFHVCTSNSCNTNANEILLTQQNKQKPAKLLVTIYSSPHYKTCLRNYTHIDTHTDRQTNRHVENNTIFR